MLNFAGLHSLLGEKVKDDSRIELARPSAHRQAVECGKAHRAFDTAAICNGAHRCSATEMSNNHLAVRNLWLDFAKPAGNVLVREAVKAVTAHALVIEILRNREMIGGCAV